MLKEILDKNKINVEDTFYFLTIDINYFNYDDELEFACLQYIKDNGFKLSWLIKEFESDKYNWFDLSKEKTKEIMKEINIKQYRYYKFDFTDTPFYIIINTRDNVVVNFECKYLWNINKLLSLLYAHDVKIINDLEGLSE